MQSDNGYLPRIGITMGDAAGIGPEVVLRACCDAQVRRCCRPILFGHPQVFERAGRLIGSDRRIHTVHAADAAADLSAENSICCLKTGSDAVLDAPPGTIDPRAGRAAHDALVAAANAALRGDIDAVVTAPLNKAALRQAGFTAPGHTELLAKLCNVNQYAMMLCLPAGNIVQSPHGLCVAHVTLHTSLASVPELLTTEQVAEKIELVDGFLRDIGCDAPRIAVCALNPHAGEGGLFGNEEQAVIAPAVEAARNAGRGVTGPLPADTLFRRAVQGEFDGVVAMYHDQGHIAFKLIGFETAVNVTLGLPIVRTSPSHGTAFDIAATGEARPDGMIEAVRVASLLARRRGCSTSIVGRDRAATNIHPRL